MEPIDLVKQFKEEYAQAKKPLLLKTRPARYLSIEGEGKPGEQGFQDAMGALFTVAYTIKMKRKFAGETDYKVAPPEAIYHCCSPWKWQLMIRVPEFIRKADLVAARKAIEAKKKPVPFEKVNLVKVSEGLCVQMLHVGPYDQVQRVVEAMASFADAQGYELAGPHHEIYFSDPHRVKPEKLKTLVRHPARKLK
jgi:hypothetical protein